MKKFIIVVVIVCLAGGGAYLGLNHYKAARQIRLVSQARRYLDRNDRHSAMLALRRALRYDAQDLEAMRLTARLNEMERSPSAVLWRNRVVELNPNSTADRLALAQTAIAFGDPATAAHALEGIGESDRNTAAYHNIAGEAAASVHDSATAESHFQSAVRLEPLNNVSQFDLAVLYLNGTNAAIQTQARTSLQYLSVNSTNLFLRCQSLRELVSDAMRRQQSAQALALTQQLLQNTNSVFNDRIIWLDVLKSSQNPQFASALGEVKQQASSRTNSADIYSFGAWQMANSTPKEGLTWLQSAPAIVQTNPPVALIIAEAEDTLGEWQTMAETLTAENWQDLEFLRRAFHTRALRGLSSSSGAKGEWDLALKAADGQKQPLSMLLSLTRKWQWQAESEELLWNIVNRYPADQAAVRDLTRALFLAGRTRSLMYLCSQRLKREPDRIDLKRDLALLALLLNAQELNPRALAREVYTTAPTNAAYAATYAFSLLEDKKNDEALQVMKNMPAKDLKNPLVAGYYGLILRASGDKPTSREYLDIALKSPALPEEKKLFEQARSSP